MFINNLISFLIVAFVLFMVIKAMNQLRRKQEEEPAAEPPPRARCSCSQEIRDTLVERCAPGRRRAGRSPVEPQRLRHTQGFCAQVASGQRGGWRIARYEAQIREKISSFGDMQKQICVFLRP